MVVNLYFLSIIIVILIIASLIVGGILVYLKKASFCLILVVFEFIIFVILFIARLLNEQNIANIYSDLAYSNNFIIGENARYLTTSIPYNDYKIFTIFTHLYLHGSPMHIISNMFFLVLLGMPFERKIGSTLFAIIFFLSGILGSLFSAFFSIYFGDVFNIDPGAVCVGASGAIFGVLGAYVALYPKDRVLFPLLIIRPWPIWLITGIYFGIETLLAASAPEDHIGHFAHIGGFLSALAIAPVLGRYKLVQDEVQKEGIVDMSLNRELATTRELKEIYLKIKNEDKPEIRNVWVEEFLSKAKCPNCGAKFTVKRGNAKCNCGYKIKY
ncbi:rhomboid family intramembrane serine protease [bacterium]|nr:rhomboid family intramembrane serine protease [bacterium]